MKTSLLLVVISTVSCVRIPSYIRTCSRESKTFNQCALESAKYALPHIVKGDPNFYLPNLKPLHIPEIEVSTGKDFSLVMRDLDVHGLDEAEPTSVNVDFEKQSCSVTLHIPAVSIVGNYEIKGRILILPIDGQGKANITLYDGDYKYSFLWNYRYRRGIKYAYIANSTIEYLLQNVHYQLDNLFNGDKRLGDAMNRFLNENWKEVHKDLYAPAGEAILAICDQISKNIYSRIPYDMLFAKQKN